MIIDAHSHLNDKQFDSDREAVLSRMKEAGVSTITVGADLQSSKLAIEIAEKNSMWATVGLHPSDNLTEVFDYEAYKNLASNKRVVAIGECGLDYYWEKTEEGRDRQKKLFLEHIRLSKETKKPLMLHIRNAYEDGLDILKQERANGIVHFFTGSYEVAKHFLDQGCVISLPGVITFGDEFGEMVKKLPADAYLVETDSPYAAPVPHRGKRNEPTYVLETIKRVAELRGTSPAKIIEETGSTAERLFALN